MKILFVITQSEMGGAQQFLAQLIGHLDRARFELVVVVGKDGGDELKKFLPDDVPYIIAKSLRRDPHILQDIRSLFELRSLYKKINPDVIFLNSSKAGFNGSLATHLWPSIQIPVVYRIGGWAFNDPQSFWKRWFSVVLEKVSAPWKDHIIVNNKKDFQDAERLHIQPRKEITLIHNGIDLESTVWSSEAARVQLIENIVRNGYASASVFRGKRIVGTVANFYATKGLEVLIDASRKLPDDVVTIIIGDGQLRLSLETQIRKNNLQNKVILAGRLPNAERYVPAFTVFALPSRKEGFPWAILEAMRARVPVVATSVGAIPEIIESDNSGVMVPPNDTEAFANALMHLLRDPDLQQKFTVHAFEKLKREFTVQHMTEQYVQLLEKLER